MSTIKVVILLASMTGLLMIIGGLLAGRLGLVIAFLVAAVMNFGAYWYSDSMVLKMYKAQQVSETQAPKVYDIVKSLSAKASLPTPDIYIIPEKSPNAFATGRNKDHAAVAVTEGILKILNKEELEGVIAHELSHIKNKDILIASIAATIYGAIVLIANVARLGALFGFSNSDNTLLLIATAIVAPVAAVIIQMAISRSR